MSRSRNTRPDRYTDKSSPLYYNWTNKDPKWWRKLYKHRVRRAENRSNINLVMKCKDLDDMGEIVHGLDSKPRIWYW